MKSIHQQTIYGKLNCFFPSGTNPEIRQKYGKLDLQKQADFGQSQSQTLAHDTTVNVKLC